MGFGRVLRAGELVFQIGQPDVVRPLVGVHPYPVRALVISAIDQHAAHAGRAHLAESDFLGTLVHSLE